MEVHQLRVKKRKTDFKRWSTLLDDAGIRTEKNIETVLGVFEKERCIATGAVFGNVIKCVAVCREYMGGAVVSLLMTNLEKIVFERYNSCYLYTKPNTGESFAKLGYQEIVKLDDQLIFMEKAVNGFSEYLHYISDQAQNNSRQAGLVINANPFTLGHQYLVERASRENNSVYVFVVSEDRSYVPFEDRLHLVKEGVKHLDNVVVLETGPYMVSQTTFPSYFLQEDQDATIVQAQLDATLFKTRIAPVMGITHRYVGQEPFSETTEIYNQQMKKVFGNDLTLIVLERKKISGQAISASLVRDLWRERDLKSIKKLVPEATYSYIEEHIEGVK